MSVAKKAVRARAAKGSEVQVPEDERFDVSKYIERGEELYATELAIDSPSSEKTFGQVREINAKHVHELVDSYRYNPPLALELTVFQDPGV
jgi:hypothetical protein